MAKNKRFLDSNGVAYLWEKINLFFSQIGHRHETSDVNGLDEYMEENAKAIRDTEKVIEVLPTLPLYPSEEQLGIIYACNGKLYKGKKLDKLVLDFSKIEGHEDERGDIVIDNEDIANFINSQGLNIISSAYIGISGEFTKAYNSLVFPYNDGLTFFQEDNPENTLYFKTAKFEVSASYNEEENFGGGFEAGGDDLYDGFDYEVGPIELPDEDVPAEHISAVLEDSGLETNPMNYLRIGYSRNFFLYKMEISLVRCYSEEDYYNGIFHDFLVWEEVSEEELPIEDTTPATEETTKRFYREVENNNIYVTDRETELTPGGFEIIINHNKNNSRIDAESELRGYLDPEGQWIYDDGGLENIYGDRKYWTDVNGNDITLTPIRIGIGGNVGGFSFYYTKPVTLCFTPYISWDNSIQKPVLDSKDAPIVRVFWYDNDDGEEYSEDYTIEKFDNDYLLDLNQLKKHYTEITLPSGNVNYFSIYTVDNDGNSLRCHLHEIYYGSKETKYKWSQIAKVQDIHDAINALPDVARTGSYTDLFNKPCIGDVQTYDWPSNEDLPIIDEGTGNCDNRLKQLLRYNNSLYTAVVNESGLTVDLRDFSKKYNTQGYCGNKLRTYIFEDRINAVSGAYQDYFVTGNTILIQNTKGIGMQIGSSNSYGEMLLTMRSEEDNQRYLFNNVDVTLQSWSSDGEKTTDNANIYVEVGTTSYQESQGQRDDESELILFVDAGVGDWWSICKKVNGELNDLTPNELQNILDTSGSTLVINGTTYSITGYEETFDDWTYCHVNLDNYDNLDYDWAYDEWNNNQDGYRIYFRQTVTEYEQVLTPQQTKNVWFKRYGDEYVEEWEETSYSTEFEEIIPSEDYISYYVYDDNTGDYAYDFLYSLVENQVLKIDGVEVIVKEVLSDDGILRVYYNDNEPNGYISILRRKYVNNPVLKETVSLQGTNCDYLKIWTQYDEDPEQYGRRGVIKTIMFNNLKYEYDPNPTYNRDIYKKDYWKQISGSGSGSIKVIDLTDEN